MQVTKTTQDQEKNKGGRPRKYPEEAKKRGLTATDKGWGGLGLLARRYNMSRSEFCDAIGKGKMEFTPKNEKLVAVYQNHHISDLGQLIEKICDEELIVVPNHAIGHFEEQMPVMKRIYSLFGQKNPHPRFLSLLWFVRRVALGLGVIKDTYENEDKIRDVVVDSIICIALRDYIFPDELVTNALADIRWVAFHRLLKEAKFRGPLEISSSLSAMMLSKESSDEVDDLDYMLISLERLSRNFPEQYRVFEMRYIQGLTGSQIQRLLEVRDCDKPLAELAKHTGRAMKNLREIFHEFRDSKKYQDDDKMKFLESSRGMEAHKKILESIPHARYYYKKLSEPFLKAGSFNEAKLSELELFLQRERFDWCLDFTLGEVDHIAGHGIDRIDKGFDRSQILQIQQATTRKIRECLDLELKDQKQSLLNQLKRELKYCGNELEEMKDTLMGFIRQKFSLDLDEQFFLKEKYSGYR